MRLASAHSIQLTALIAALACSQPATAAVQVVRGPTPIPDGEAAAAGDLTVFNDRLAFGIAVESSAPYGVPRGALIDLAQVVGGKPGRDRVVYADFIPNNWSAWPNTYQKVEVVERGPQQVVVKTVRDWGKVTIATTYTLRDHSDRIELSTTMTNGGDATLVDLASGHSLWPSAGYFFAVQGVPTVAGKPATALTTRATAYDEDWAITLHAPYLDYDVSGANDLLQQHALRAGESRTFQSWLQVTASGDLAPAVAAEIEGKHLAAGAVHGTVTTRASKAVARPVVVVARQGLPYAWTLGHDGQYELPLPAGDYELYATATGHSQSRPTTVHVVANGNVTTNFADLQPPGQVEFVVTDLKTGQGLDARIAITQGQKPLVEYLGRSTFFTELERKGHYSVPMAPGHYGLQVTSGGVFLGPAAHVTLDVVAGQPVQSKIALERLFDPPATGWYSADLHHHADQAEGVTPPEYLARSQLAAGLDLLFVSDHDSTANHAPLQRIADRRGMPFIPSMEISPSWGHFNAWPLQPQGRKLAIDTSTASIDAVLAEARRQGALVVQSNHPFISYGYFSSVAAGVAPGGFNPAFELLEINGNNSGDDGKVTRALWDMWNAGHRYYMSAGTDVHDVWNFESGAVRLYAHLDGAPTAVSFANAARAGHSYVSYGPLIVPGVLFGSELKVKTGAGFVLPFELESVTGLKQARLIGAGTVVATRDFTDGPRQARVEYALQAARPTWYSIEVEDTAGRLAYSNPIWIDVLDSPTAAAPR